MVLMQSRIFKRDTVITMAHSNASKAQIVEIVNQLGNGRINAKLAQALIEGRVEILDKPREQTGSPYRGGPSSDLPPDHYRITVASTATPTYGDLESAYDWVSDLWNESKYALELHESLREITPSTGDKVVFVKKFDRATASEKAIAWGKGHGYRLAFPAEREAFAKANPDLQRKFWIVDLGSFALRGGLRRVPVLYEGDGGRRLGDVWFDGGWGADGRFLFVRDVGDKENRLDLGEKAHDQKSLSDDQAKSLAISSEGYHWLIKGWANEDGSRGIFRPTKF
jgi:hypothetical protein